MITAVVITAVAITAVVITAVVITAAVWFYAGLVLGQQRLQDLAFTFDRWTVR